MSRYIGIDPGKAGAAVAVGDDGLTVLWRLKWSRAARPPRLNVVIDPGDVVALEQPFVGQSKRGALTLATWCGEMLAQLPEGVRVLRPLAAHWRAKVLRMAGARREAAKIKAIAAARPYLGDCTADEAEAWCMARYAWGWAQAHPVAA